MRYYQYFRIFLVILIFVLLPCYDGLVPSSLIKKLPALELLSRNTSVVISTLPLQLSLSKLAYFAQGDLRREMLAALGFGNTDQINPMYERIQDLLGFLTKIDFIMFNKIFVNYTNDFKNSFLSTRWSTQVEKVSFNYPEAAAMFINKQVDTACYKRINDMVHKNDINDETSIVMVIATYLKPIWEVPFDMRFTKYMKFRSHDRGILSVPMMRKQHHVLYVNDQLNNLQVVNVMLGSPGASMTFVVPFDKQSLIDFLNNLETPNYLASIRKRMRVEKVNVLIPRFKIKSATDWTGSLQKIGLHRLLQKNNTDLNSILKDNIKNKSAYVSMAKQKNFIQVEEMSLFQPGLESESFKRDPVDSSFGLEFLADRPFYFCVNLHYDRADYLSSEDLFNGVYYGPD